MRSVIGSYRTQPTPAQQQTPTIAGRIVPIATRPDPRPALLVLAALVLPLLAIGVVVYAAQSVQAAPVAVATPTVEVTPAAPVVIVVTPTPASEVQVAPQVQVAPTLQVQAPPVLPQVGQVAPVAPPAQAQARPQAVQPAPQAAPVQVQPTARKPQAPQVAPQPQAQVQRPAASQPAPTVPAGYLCADGRFFPAGAAEWERGYWTTQGAGNVVHVRDVTENNYQTFGWHYNCRRVQ